MIFDDDVAVLEAFVSSFRVTADRCFHETEDQEVERHLNSSPLLMGTDTTLSYEPDSNDLSDEEALSKKEIKRASKKVMSPTASEQEIDILATIFTKVVDAKSLFKTEDVEKLDQTSADTRKPVSALTALIANADSGALNAIEDERGKIKLKLYFPDDSTLKLFADQTDTIGDIIRKALIKYKHINPDGEIDADAPERFELRMNEDGETDMDFPPFSLDKRLRDLNETDFSICEIAEDDDSDFPQHNKPKVTIVQESRVDDEQDIPDGTIVVCIPNVGQVRIEYSDSDNFVHLLPKIASQQYLRLFTDEYEFKITPEKQKELKLSYDVMKMTDNIKAMRVKKVDLHRRVFEDAKDISAHHRRNNLDDRERDAPETVSYNDATANAYQEWNIVKKNLLGRRQDRVIGIDGTTIYNSKRGQFSRHATGVHRPQRDISSIRKVEFVSDRKSFRITWVEKRDSYELEYTCETVRDCAEIVAKLRYLLARQLSR